MKYTIEQINEAWIQFCTPKYLVSKYKGDIKDLKPGSTIEYDYEMPTKVFRTDFISFLVGYFSKGNSDKEVGGK